jgi:hypothetical protein
LVLSSEAVVFGAHHPSEPAARWSAAAVMAP